MINKELVNNYTVNFAENNNFKYEISSFPSGASMIHLWVFKDFYCVQIEENRIGFSKIDDEPAFSTIADIYYEDFGSFKAALHKLKEDNS